MNQLKYMGGTSTVHLPYAGDHDGSHRPLGMIRTLHHFYFGFPEMGGYRQILKIFQCGHFPLQAFWGSPRVWKNHHFEGGRSSDSFGAQGFQSYE